MAPRREDDGSGEGDRRAGGSGGVAARHLPNKTLIMQWFAAWAGGSSLIKADDWKDVRRVTASRSAMIAGAASPAMGMVSADDDKAGQR